MRGSSSARSAPGRRRRPRRVRLLVSRHGEQLSGAAAARRRDRRWVRRYHPIAPDMAHRYQVAFGSGRTSPFRDLTRNAWRWAWNTLKPAVTYIDVELVRRVLTDHLVAQAATIDGRTAIPFVLSTVSDELQWNWTMAAMGFVGKNLECADQLLREGDRDKTERGQKMRQTGLAVIASMIQALPTVPLQATGYDLATGKPARPRLARPLAAQRHRGHARADARLPARARPGPPAPGVVQLGEEVRGLAGAAAEARTDRSPGGGSAGATRSRSRRGRRATIPCRCSS